MNAGGTGRPISSQRLGLCGHQISKRRVRCPHYSVVVAAVLLGSWLTKGYCTSKATRSRPDSSTIIARLYNPLAIFMTDNTADMMRKDDDCANSGSAYVAAKVSPVPSQVVGCVSNVHPHPHLKSTPCRGSSTMRINSEVMFHMAIAIGLAYWLT